MNYEISHPEMFSHAMDFYGLKEIPGEEDNPQILEFFSEIGHDRVKDDETAWCSAWINYLAKVTGYARSGKLTARSWLKVGTSVSNPTPGDIVVFWRESVTSWKGHVGIFIRDDGTFIWTLGGNQNNSVCIKPYPKERLLDYRMLNKVS
jgi:uncharacterized protein (TIGR02594 family)